MLFFLSILFFVGFFSYLEIFGKLSGDAKKIIYYALCFFFFCLSFLRWEYGTDWTMYLNNFKYYDVKKVSFEYEPLYYFFVVNIRNMTGNYTYLLFVFSAILFYCQSKAIIKLSPLPITTLMVLTGILFCNVGYVRQTIAMSLLLYSIVFIIDKKIVMFVLFVIIAMGFHRSSIVFLPAYWLFNLKFGRKGLILLLLMSLLFLVLSQVVVSKLLYFMSGAFLQKFSWYMDAGNANTTSYDTFFIFFKTFINRSSILIFGYYILYVRKELDNTYLRNYINLYSISFIIYCLFCSISLPLARVANFYDFQFLIIPYFLLIKPVRKKKGIIFIILLSYLVVRMYVYVNSYEGLTDHYYFIPEIEMHIQ